jgi:hypothetical protein
VAEGKALDLMQAGSVEGFATQLSGSTDMMTAGGADIVIVADRAGGIEWQGEDGLRLVGRLREIAPAAVILLAGASQPDRWIAVFATCTSIGGGFSAPRPRRWPQAREAWWRWPSTAPHKTSR